MQSITPQLAKRYARQVLLPDVDLDGQEALLNARVLQIGAGGLGCAAAQYLVAAGLGQLTLVDHDQVDVSNLHRQILHTHSDLGLDKVVSAKNSLQTLNPNCDIAVLNEKLSTEDMAQAVEQHQLVLDCTDNLETRQLINRACVEHKTPLVSAAAIRFEGQVSTFTMGLDSPCYNCLSHVFPEQALSCVEAGVMGPVVGVIGSIQAMEAIKIICSLGQILDAKLLMVDTKSMTFNTFKLNKQADCQVCSNR